MSALRSASPYLSSNVISLAVQSGIFSDDSLNAILNANSPLPEDAMESMIADITVGAGNSAPEIELNTNLLSNITTDLEPEVQVRVNSIQVKNLTANPSLVIAASNKCPL